MPYNTVKNYEPSSGGGGGNALTAQQEAVLAHLALSASGETRLLTDIPLQTTEHSLYLGDVFSVSAANRELFFTNQESGIVASAPVTYMGDHSSPAGQTVSEVMRKKYGAYLEKPLGDNTNVLPAVAYSRSATPLENTASYGTTFRTAESYTGGLHYMIKVGTRVVQHRHYDVVITSGEVVTQFWKEPTVSIKDVELTIELSKDDGSDLMVYADSVATTRPWVISNSRSFVFEDMMDARNLKNFASAISLASGSGEIPVIQGITLADVEGNHKSLASSNPFPTTAEDTYDFITIDDTVAEGTYFQVDMDVDGFTNSSSSVHGFLITATKNVPLPYPSLVAVPYNQNIGYSAEDIPRKTRVSFKVLIDGGRIYIAESHKSFSQVTLLGQKFSNSEAATVVDSVPTDLRLTWTNIGSPTTMDYTISNLSVTVL
ncbi:hypothetical protein COPG_00046 [Colwellia phage 9A]|uniref:Uncharacterized protein n=1 Tax=Colwellia phage 9A TaxID=765765 RepID=I3UMC7_9CAUD|nr:hypothetical protein COPG_00046 [Colwellia phage 9A]AFK66642.1 hypothetical protein COPG_00046 [Colwellia phage 9A]